MPDCLSQLKGLLCKHGLNDALRLSELLLKFTVNAQQKKEKKGICPENIGFVKPLRL